MAKILRLEHGDPLENGTPGALDLYLPEGAARLEVLAEPDATLQRLRDALAVAAGDWFLDGSVGVDSEILLGMRGRDPAPGYPLIPPEVEVRRVLEAVEGVRVEMHLGGGVEGTVSDRYGRPVVGDVVLAVASARTNGRFPPTAVEQARRALQTIAQALAQADASLQDVVNVRVYLADRADVMEVSQVLGQAFRDPRPTNTTILCGFPVEDIKVEFEVTALRRRAG